MLKRNVPNGGKLTPEMVAELRRNEWFYGVFGHYASGGTPPYAPLLAGTRQPGDYWNCHWSEFPGDERIHMTLDEAELLCASLRKSFPWFEYQIQVWYLPIFE